MSNPKSSRVWRLAPTLGMAAICAMASHSALALPKVIGVQMVPGLVQSMICGPMSLVSSQLGNGVAQYELKQTCSISESAQVEGYSDDWVSVDSFQAANAYNIEVNVKAQYAAATKDAIEIVNWKLVNYTSNEKRGEATIPAQGTMGPMPRYFWKATSMATHGVGGGPFPQLKGWNFQITANCSQNPFTAKVSPDKICKGQQFLTDEAQAGTTNRWASRFNKYYDTVTTGSSIDYWYTLKFPYFFAARQVDPAASEKLDQKADQAAATKVELTHPAAGQNFIETDVLFKALFPSSYKANGQTCCLLEFEFSDLATPGVWKPVNKTKVNNLDTAGYHVPFASFAPAGYGRYRVRISPNKVNDWDQAPWTGWYEFNVIKVSQTVPTIMTPLEGATLTSAVPIRISTPPTADKAGESCCEIQFQSKDGTGWRDFKTVTDKRLSENDATVNFDLGFFTGAPSKQFQMRARLYKGSTFNSVWSSWRGFSVQDKPTGSISAVKWSVDNATVGDAISLTVEGSGKCNLQLFAPAAWFGKTGAPMDLNNTQLPLKLQGKIGAVGTYMAKAIGLAGDGACVGESTSTLKVAAKSTADAEGWAAGTAKVDSLLLLPSTIPHGAKNVPVEIVINGVGAKPCSYEITLPKGLSVALLNPQTGTTSIYKAYFPIKLGAKLDTMQPGSYPVKVKAIADGNSCNGEVTTQLQVQ